jgi:putative ATPase
LTRCIAFNKVQQDAFLPHIERGTIIFVGATTENPSFELNSALLSRCRVHVMEAVSARTTSRSPSRALLEERGLGDRELQISDDLVHIAPPLPTATCVVA